MVRPVAQICRLTQKKGLFCEVAFLKMPIFAHFWAFLRMLKNSNAEFWLFSMSTRSFRNVKKIAI